MPRPRIPVVLAALLPTNPTITSSDRHDAWLLLLIPIDAVICLAAMASAMGKNFFDVVHGYSVLQMFSPARISHLLSSSLTIYDFDIVAAIFLPISAYAITVCVAGITRPPYRYNYMNTRDRRARCQVQYEYLYHMYTVPFILYALMDYFAMTIGIIPIVNNWLKHSEATATIVSSYNSTSEFAKDVFRHMGVFFLCWSIWSPLGLNLVLLVNNVLDAFKYLKEITYPHFKLLAVYDSFVWDCSDLEENCNFGAWERCLRWAAHIDASNERLRISPPRPLNNTQQEDDNPHNTNSGRHVRWAIEEGPGFKASADGYNEWRDAV